MPTEGLQRPARYARPMTKRHPSSILVVGRFQFELSYIEETLASTRPVSVIERTKKRAWQDECAMQTSTTYRAFDNRLELTRSLRTIR